MSQEIAVDLTGLPHAILEGRVDSVQALLDARHSSLIKLYKAFDAVLMVFQCFSCFCIHLRDFS